MNVINGTKKVYLLENINYGDVLQINGNYYLVFKRGESDQFLSNPITLIGLEGTFIWNIANSFDDLRRRLKNGIKDGVIDSFKCFSKDEYDLAMVNK